MTLRRMRIFSDRLLGWPVPALLIVMLPFLAGRARGADLTLLAVWLALLAVYLAYWYWEYEWPARYISEAMPMLFVLAGRGCDLLLGSSAAHPLRRAAARAGGAIVASGFLVSASVGQPYEMRNLPTEYANVEYALPRIIREAGVHHAVVFMRELHEGEPVDRLEADNDYYATGFMRNDLDLQGDVIYARDLGDAHNRELMAAYPDRKYYGYAYVHGRGKGILNELAPAAGGARSDFP